MTKLTKKTLQCKTYVANLTEFSDNKPEIQSLNQEIDYVLFYPKNGRPSTQSSSGQISKSTWQDFVKTHLVHKPYADKGDAPLILGGKTTGGRKKDDILNRSLVIVDIEKQKNKQTGVVFIPPYDLLEQTEIKMKEQSLDWIFAGYSTFSHTKTAPRFRLMFLLKEPIDPGDYNLLTSVILKKLNLTTYADDCSDRVTKVMFLPSHPNQTEETPISIYGGTVALDWRELLKEKVEEPIIMDSDHAPRKKKTRKNTTVLKNQDMDLHVILDQYLTHVYTKESENRYRLNISNAEGGLIVNDDGTCYSFHSNDDPVADGCIHNAYDLVKLHLCNNDDKQTMQWFVEHNKSDDPIIEFSFPKKANSRIKINMVLLGHPNFIDIFWFDEQCDRVCLEKDLILYEVNYGKAHSPLESIGYKAIWFFLGKEYNIRSPFQEVRYCIQVVAEKKRGNRIKRYIESCDWDKTDRISPFLKKAGAVDLDNAFVKVCFEKFLISCIAKLYTDNVPVDVILLLQGDSGVGKSTIAKRLSGKFGITAQMSDIQGFSRKDAFTSFLKKFIVIFDEFDTHNSKEEQTIKALTSIEEHTIRKSYEPEDKDYCVHYSFIATTNTLDVIRDMALARRIWGLRITKDLVGEKSDFLKEISSDYFIQQLWAQALCYYKKERSYRLTIEEENARKEFISMFKEDNPWESVIINYLSEKKVSEFTSADILHSTDILSAKGLTTLEELERKKRLALGREISDAAKSLGLSPCRIYKFGKQERGWKLKDDIKRSEFLAKYIENKTNTK